MFEALFPLSLMKHQFLIVFLFINLKLHNIKKKFPSNNHCHIINYYLSCYFLKYMVESWNLSSKNFTGLIIINNFIKVEFIATQAA